MAIDENVLFKTIYENNSDKPIEFIMEQVARAKNAFKHSEEALKRKPEPEPEPVQSVEEAAPAEESAFRRLTKRSLKFDPATAITDDSIICCLCGTPMQTLSAAHLRLHGTTPEAYRRLCDYEPKQPLMSKRRLETMRSTVMRAQQARKKVRMKTQSPAATPEMQAAG